MGVVGLLMGLFFIRQTRLLMALFPLWACLVGLGFVEGLQNKSKLISRSVGGLLVLILYAQWVIGLEKIQVAFSPLNVLLGKQTSLEYRLGDPTKMNIHPSDLMYEYMGRTLNLKNRVLILGEEKVYPLKIPYFYSGVFDNNEFVNWCNQAHDPKDVLQEIQRRGISHFFVNQNEVFRVHRFGVFDWTQEGFQVFSDLWANNLKLVKHISSRQGPSYENHLLLFEFDFQGSAGEKNPIPNFFKALPEFAPKSPR